MATAVESNTHPTHDRLLCSSDVTKRLNVGRATWWLLVKQGRAPAGVLISPRNRRWRESELDSYISSLSK